MSAKTLKQKEIQTETRDEHESEEQVNSQWLNDLQNALSPYWSSRLEYQTEKNAQIVVLEGLGTKGR